MQHIHETSKQTNRPNRSPSFDQDPDISFPAIIPVGPIGKTRMLLGENVLSTQFLIVSPSNIGMSSEHSSDRFPSPADCSSAAEAAAAVNRCVLSHLSCLPCKLSRRNTQSCPQEDI